MDDDVLLAEAFQPRAPAIGVVFSVGEDHDGPSLSMLLGIDGHCFDGGVEGSAQVGAAGRDRAGLQSIERIEHGTEVFRERAAKHAAPGKRHHGRSVGGILPQRFHQASGDLDCHGQAIWDSVLSRHAPADVDDEHEVVARRKVR